jgi:uncharacterized protein DUF5330
MVNDRFRAASIYGFEMVDARAAQSFRAIVRHQSKIYVESNHSGFQKIFGDFTSMETLPIYRRLLVRNKLRFNRNTTIRDDRGREMFFLLRMAFWLGLVLVLLPREKTPESDKVPQIGASEAVSAATAAVSDMGQFCKRQPAACEVGGQAATVLGQRAQDGARKIYKIITKPDHPGVPDKKPDHTSSIGDDAEATVVTAPTADALTEEDMAIEWRMPRTPLASK